ncbi:aspartate--tRNA ligase, partial [Acinetobacter baumannii]
DGKWTAVHHPFTVPKSSVEDVKSNLGEARCVAYNRLLNGTEVGGGAVRIYTLEIQNASLEAVCISDEEA